MRALCVEDPELVGHVVELGKCDADFSQDSVRQVVDKAMNEQSLSISPGSLHDGNFGDVYHLLLDVKFHQRFLLLFLGADQGVSKLASELSQVTQPGFQGSKVVGTEGCLDSSTPVMPHYHNILNVKVLNGVL